MIPWTTPTQEIVVEGMDLTGCDCYVSYTQGSRCREVRAEPTFDGTDTTLVVEWTQEQSAMFREGEIEVQVNYVYPGDKRCATERLVIEVDRNLMKREVPYGDL